jgi:hypothetical protein
MADNVLQMDTIPTNHRGPSDHLWGLYRHYRLKKAEWDMYTYSSPEHVQTNERDSDHCDANAQALNDFLLEPAVNIADLSLKLRIFKEEEIHDGWKQCSMIVGVLAADAHRLAHGGC